MQVVASRDDAFKELFDRRVARNAVSIASEPLVQQILEQHLARRVVHTT